LRDIPFKVEAIQVDGGSEFMAEFEQACQDKAIRLYVLPPKCPQMNGAVERCNGAWRYEFYSVYDLPRNVDDLNPILDSFSLRESVRRTAAAVSANWTVSAQNGAAALMCGSMGESFTDVEIWIVL
jgi:putative transposase